MISAGASSPLSCQITSPDCLGVNPLVLAVIQKHNHRIGRPDVTFAWDARLIDDLADTHSLVFELHGLIIGCHHEVGACRGNKGRQDQFAHAAILFVRADGLQRGTSAMASARCFPGGIPPQVFDVQYSGGTARCRPAPPPQIKAVVRLRASFFRGSSTGSCGTNQRPIRERCACRM